jgi:hypothetical protein
MKVRYTKRFTDEHGMTFLPGWVAEHSQSDCEKRISQGFAAPVEDGTRALRYAPSAPVLVDACAVPDAPEGLYQPMEQDDERKGPKVFKTK